MQALTISIQYATAKQDQNNDGLLAAIHNAKMLGIGARFNSNDTPVPFEFKDESDLANAYEEGIAWLDNQREMQKCPRCNDGSGHPCSAHG